MTLNDFIKKHSGKFLEVAGSANAKNQCVDLANGYIRNVLKLPIIEWTNAKDFPNHPIAKEHFDYIRNTPTGLPKKGDLIIWGGRWGHIAIYLSGNVNWFTSLDQNWPTGSKCHKVDHSYSNVKGWLRKKGGSMPNDNDLSQCLKQHKKLMAEIKHKDIAIKSWIDKSNKTIEELEEARKTISKQAKKVLILEKEEKILMDKLETADEKLIKAEKAKKEWHKLYKQIKKNNKTLTTDNTAFQITITKLKESSIISAESKTLCLELIRRLFKVKREVVST